MRLVAAVSFVIASSSVLAQTPPAAPGALITDSPGAWFNLGRPGEDRLVWCWAADRNAGPRCYVPEILRAASHPATYDRAVSQSDPAPTGKGFVAALAGPVIVTTPASSSGDFHLSFGLRAGLPLYRDSIGEGTLGVAFQTLSDSARVSGVEADGQTSFLAVEFFSRRAWDSGLYFGARAGLGFSSIELSSGSTKLRGSATAFAFAPVIGYEIPVARSVSAMIDASWVGILERDMTIGSTTTTLLYSSGVFIQAGVSVDF